MGSSSIRDIQDARAAKATQAQAHPDAFWDPNRTDPAYRNKVIHHRQINQFLTSSRRDDPAYRAVMVKLLENGYSVSEWIDFVGVASHYHMPVALGKATVKARGLLPDKAEEALIPVRAHQEAMRKHIYEHCRIVMGMTDREFIDELLAIELPYRPGDQVLGTGPVPILPGDPLNTGADWMDEEFLAAAERYDGPPRPSRDLSEPVLLDPSEQFGELPATRFELPEE